MYELWLESEGFFVDMLDIEGEQGVAAFMTGERDDVLAAINMTQEVVANDDAGNETVPTIITMSWTPNG